MDHSRKAIAVGIMVILCSVACACLVTGCTSSSAPGNGLTMVNMVASFSKAGPTGFAKSTSFLGIDSLRIDSAIVVISSIKFLAQRDTERADSGNDEHALIEGGLNTGGDDHEGDDEDSSLVFRGPFVIHVHDTVAIDFAGKMLPAGTYDAILLKIRRLGAGEHHWDSDEHSSHECWSDSGFAGASITVWGAIFKDSSWKQFTYKLNDNLEFKIKGNFNVPVSTSTVNIALHINMDSWFKNPADGSILDPTNTSLENRTTIRHAIERAFNQCKGGHDWAGDGHPDD